MARAKLAVPDRQVTIRTNALIENLHMTRTAHGFQAIGLAFMSSIMGLILTAVHGIHAGLKFIPMPAALPKRTRQQLRRTHFAKAGASHSTPDVILHHAIKLPPTRMPEHHSRSFVLLMEQVQLVA